jgi:hypothetical protein
LLLPDVEPVFVVPLPVELVPSGVAVMSPFQSLTVTRIGVYTPWVTAAQSKVAPGTKAVTAGQFTVAVFN